MQKCDWLYYTRSLRVIKIYRVIWLEKKEAKSNLKVYKARFILNFMFYIFTLWQDINDSSGFFKLMHKKEQCHEIYQTDTGAATKLTDT